MKLLLKILAGLLLAIVALFALQMVASESGEVVVLTTTDDAGASQETRLWVVELNGAWYLRAGSGQAGWFQRLSARPDVTVIRNDAPASYRAQPSVAERDAVNALMADKYGWADRFIGWLFGRDDAVPVLITPTP